MKLYDTMQKMNILKLPIGIRIITVFATISIVKILLNIYYYVWICRYLKMFIKRMDVIEKKKNNDQSEYWYFVENKQKIVKLLQKAGIKNRNIPIAQPIGNNHLSTGFISYFDNIDRKDHDIPATVYSDLREAKNIFCKGIFQSLNPFFWIETILFLPKSIFNYLGFNTDRKIIKFTNILYWIACILVWIFENELRFGIKKIMHVSQ